MLTKVINYLKYRFTPGITVAILEGDVRLHYAELAVEYKQYFLYLRENQYGRKYWGCSGYYNKSSAKKYCNQFKIIFKWLHGYNYRDIPSYLEIVNKEKNVLNIKNYWDK